VGGALRGRGLDDSRVLDDGGVVDRVRRDVAEVVTADGEPAVDPGRVAHAAGVHADQVVGVEHAVGQAPGRQQRGLREPGTARAARVEQEHAAPRGGVVAGHPGQLELDLLAAGVGVVQRHGHLRTGQDVGCGLRHDVVRARAPLDLCGGRAGGCGALPADVGRGGHGERADQAQHGQQGRYRMRGSDVGSLHAASL
jgi:hypothetical protein